MPTKFPDEIQKEQKPTQQELRHPEAFEEARDKHFTSNRRKKHYRGRKPEEKILEQLKDEHLKTPVMRRNPGPAPMAVDWGLFDRLAYIQCNPQEIAAVMGMCEKTLDKATRRDKDKTLYQYIKERQAPGCMSIRRKMWEYALDGGNVQVLLFIAKHYLGMGDKVNVKVDSNQPTTVNIQNNTLNVEYMTEEDKTTILEVFAKVRDREMKPQTIEQITEELKEQPKEDNLADK